jgi:hypothetical protein
MEKYLKKIPADVFVHPPVAKENLPEHKNKKEIEKWLRTEPLTLSFSEVWKDLNELLAKKCEFKTLTKESKFTARILDDRGTKLIEDYKKFLVIETKTRTHKIEYEQLLHVWQQFRTHGYLRRGIVSNLMEREMSYLIPILSELDYVQTVELSETGKFSNMVSGIQYMAPPRLEQPTLFSL